MSFVIMNVVRQNPFLFHAATGGVLCASSDALAQHWEQQQQQHHPLPEKRRRPYDYLAPSSPRVPPTTSDTTTSTTTSTTSIMMSSTLLSSFSLDWWRFLSAGCLGSFLGGVLYPAAYARIDAYFVVAGTTRSTTSHPSWKIVLQKSLLEIATVGILVNTLSMMVRGMMIMTRRRSGDDDDEDVDSTSTIKQVLQHVANELPTVTQNDVLVWLPYNLVAFSCIPTVIRPTTTAIMEASWQTYISLRAHDYHQDVSTTTTTTTTTTSPASNSNPDPPSS